MNKLDEIFEYKRAELSRGFDLADVKARAEDVGPTRGFLGALKSAPGGVGLIAEVKKASPVFGVIRDDFDPVSIALSYESAGAQCLSVLTDAPFFQGSEKYLRDIRSRVALPILRKDFTAGEFHVYEARAMGADAILLIVYGLSDSELVEYRELAESLGMDVLVEAHSAEECDRALASGAKILGINNRDLRTFEISIGVGAGLIPLYTERAFVVSESALHSHGDVETVAAAGARAVLIGTAFCKEPDIEAAVRRIMNWSK